MKNIKLNSKFINFEHDDPTILEKKIYRYTSFESLKYLIGKSVNTFSKVTSWKKYDPFENVLFEFPITANNETIYLQNLSHHYYAQCWTRTVEADVMWQLYRYRYSAEGGVVKLETTIEKLLNSCAAMNFVHIGKVSYLSKKKLVDHSKSLRANLLNILQENGSSGRPIAEQLLIKRFPYHLEKEIRLLVPKYDFKEANTFPDHFDYSVSPEEIFTKIVLDPTLKDDEFRAKKKEIKNLKNDLNIVRSNLYKLNKEDFED